MRRPALDGKCYTEAEWLEYYGREAGQSLWQTAYHDFEQWHRETWWANSSVRPRAGLSAAVRSTAVLPIAQHPDIVVLANELAEHRIIANIFAGVDGTLIATLARQGHPRKLGGLQSQLGQVGYVLGPGPMTSLHWVAKWRHFALALAKVAAGCVPVPKPHLQQDELLLNEVPPNDDEPVTPPPVKAAPAKPASTLQAPPAALQPAAKAAPAQLAPPLKAAPPELTGAIAPAKAALPAPVWV